MNKKKQNILKSSLFLGILVSGGIFTIVSVFGKRTIYQTYEVDWKEQPQLSVMFEAAKDGVYPWAKLSDVVDKDEIVEVAEDDSVEVFKHQEDTTDLNKQEDPNKKPDKGSLTSTEDEKEPDKGTLTSTEDEKEPEKGTLTSTEDGKEPEDTSEEEDLNNEDKTQESGTNEDKKDGEDDEDQEEKLVASLGKVEKKYFDDVLFIGDSRTVGLHDYSELTNATYYADTGLSVYNIGDKKLPSLGKKNLSIIQVLKEKDFKEIYIMLGVNELGTGTPESFAAKYKELVDELQEIQPNAYIVIQAIMNLGQEKSDHDSIYNNDNITARNAEIEKIADQTKIFYINVNDVITDKKGYLPKDYTFDDVHLKAVYYKIWAEFLMENGIVEQ